MIENKTQSNPPTTGVGIVENAAATLPKKANIIIIIAPHCITFLLPTYEKK